MKLTGETKIFLGILVTTVAIIGIAVFFISKPAPPPTPLPREELIAADSHTIGNASASAYLVEFSDFQCPACRAFAPIVDEIVNKYNDKLLFVYRHFPLDQHSFAINASLTAEAAGNQGKFWEMYTLLFTNQEKFSEAPWKDLANQLNLNLDQYEADVLNPEGKAKLMEKIDKDKADGTKFGVNSTPTFFLNGIKLTIANPNDLKNTVEKVMQ